MALDHQGDRFLGRASGRELGELLITHNGGYSSEDIAAIRRMLVAQVQTPPLFQDQCSRCHDSAAELIRDQVVVRDGDLWGRASGQRLAEFMGSHGRLNAEETARILDVLRRVVAEVHHP